MILGPAVRIGSVELPAPVMTASGTAGHGAELAPYMDLSALGAVVVKSLAAFEWAGNPSPRVHPAGAGMINAVGLQGPGIRHWLADELPALLATGARVVASIWGRSVDEYRRAAQQLAQAPAGVVAVEVNLSCPNLEGRRGIFAHDAQLSADVVAAAGACGRPLWAKLSPNTDRVVEVAGAVREAGADAVTLSNTLLGMVLDPATGVGGVACGWDAAELMLAGACAVQVGTATFADPKAPLTVQRELLAWCAQRGLSPSALVGLAHRGGLPARG